jgi:hypothetical protein
MPLGLTSVYLAVQFHHLVTKKKWSYDLQQSIYGGKIPNSPHFKKKKKG